MPRKSGAGLLLLQQTPKPGVSGGDEQENGDDGAHSRLNHTGPAFWESEPVP